MKTVSELTSERFLVAHTVPFYPLEWVSAISCDGRSALQCHLAGLFLSGEGCLSVSLSLPAAT